MSSFHALKAQRDGRNRSTTSTSTNARNEESSPATSSSHAPIASSSKAEGTIYDLPQGVEVRRIDRRGRGLYATQYHKAGTRILRTKPLVAVNSTRNLKFYCSACHLSPAEIAIGHGPSSVTPTLKRCVGCKVVYYCSQKCQVEDWPAHREECAAHKRLRTEYTRAKTNTDLDHDTGWIKNEKYRALGRLCWARKRDRRNGQDSRWWTHVEAMESHVTRMSGDQVMELGQQVQRFRQYLSAADNETASLVNLEEFGFSKSAELLHLFSAFQINSFTLSSPSLSPIGVAMSPLVALCNHSCEPNAVVVFPQGGKDMDTVAIRPISPGEEILTSYIDVSLPFVDRQSDLKTRYGFDCDCTLCSKSVSGDWIDPRWSAMGQAGDKIEPMTDDVVIQMAVGKAKVILKEEERGVLDPREALPRLSTLVPELSRRLPPSSHPLLALLRLRGLLLSPPASLIDHQTALQSLALAFSGAEQVYPSGHPTLAIISAEWSKLAAMELSQQDPSMVWKRLMDAVIGLRKTVQLCEVGFGPGGGLVGSEMRSLLQGCELEQSQMRAQDV